MLKLFILFLAALGASLPLNAVNAALGKKVFFSQKPNHSFCSDAGDISDLTDGRYSPPEIWSSKGTVGWRVYWPQISITVDLEKDTALDRVVFGTAGGSSGVQYPSFINVEVSVDGKTFHQLGSLTALSRNRYPAVDAGYHSLRFDAQFKAVKARFVRLRCVPAGPWFFCDEFEIHSTAAHTEDLTKLPLALDDKEFIRQIPRSITENCVQRSMNSLLSVLLERKCLSAQQAEGFKKRIDSWQCKEDPGEFRPFFPIDDLHRELFALNAGYLRRSGVKGIVCSFAPSVWQNISPLDRPVKNAAKKVSVAMMNGEVRPLAVNITNADSKDRILEIKLKNLPGDITEVKYLEGNDLKLSSTVLDDISDKVTIPAGMTVQFFIRLKPENLAPGRHSGKVAISGKNFKQELPVDLDISQIRFPQQVTMYNGMWDFLDFHPANKDSWGLKRELIPRILKLRKEYFFNVTFGYTGLLINKALLLKLDKAGNLAPLDFTLFDKWVDMMPDSKRYFVGMAVNVNHSIAGKISPGHKDFARLAAQWAKQFNDHLVKKKLTGKRVILHFWDEPTELKHYAAIRQWSEIFKKYAPEISIYNNPLRTPRGFMKEISGGDILCPVVDIVAKNEGNCQKEFVKFGRQKNKELWLYRCGAGPFNSNFAYFRLQPWYAWTKGGNGSLFWALCGIPRDNVVNQYLTQAVYYPPFIFDHTKIMATKHAEAMRQGIQDSEYLFMLRRKAEKSAPAEKVRILRDVQNIVNTTVDDRKIQEVFSADASLSNNADAGRIKLLKLLEK